MPPAGAAQVSEERQASFFTKVYGWMSLGLGFSAVASWGMIASGAAVALAASPALVIGLVVVELALVIGLMLALPKISAGTAAGLFFAYAALNGVTLAPVLLLYTAGSVVAALAVSAGMFAGMATLGTMIKKDLSGIGGIAIMALWGVILASVVNWFMRSAGLDLVLTYASVLIFVALTAYDAQRIKQMARGGAGDKAAVVGALTLYLDFVNLFLNLLKLLGKRKD